MIPFSECPVCGNTMVEKNVEKLLRGGTNTATVKVKAEVCLHCGERLYSKETIHQFEDIRRKLELRDTKEFSRVGESYTVALT
ncbi:MAG: YgiT-type zinc finger protein [Ignavibacteriae bacterium]|nr:YgiT-type zinc finger protein [Ignavibacteriota bacterium]